MGKTFFWEGGGMVGREEMNGVGEIIIGEWIGEMGVKTVIRIEWRWFRDRCYPLGNSR